MRTREKWKGDICSIVNNEKATEHVVSKRPRMAFEAQVKAMDEGGWRPLNKGQSYLTDSILICLYNNMPVTLIAVLFQTSYNNFYCAHPSYYV